jgi:hypothetical protein
VFATPVGNCTSVPTRSYWNSARRGECRRPLASAKRVSPHATGWSDAHPVNSQQSLARRSAFTMLAYVPLGLLALTAVMRSRVVSEGPSSSVLALDLLGLAMGALVGWLGGEFMAAPEVAAEPHPAPRPRSRFTRKAV